MKKSNLLILLFTVIALTAISCGPKPNNDDPDKDRLQFNLSNFDPLPDTTGASYNKQTHVFTKHNEPCRFFRNNKEHYFP